MKYYYIKTLGCKTNQIESNLIAEDLENLGMLKAKNEKEADLFILNSCSVTSNADNEAIRILRKAKKDNPENFTVLTGCFAQLEASTIQNYDFIDMVLGNTEKMNITYYLKQSKKVNVSDIFAQNKFLYKRIKNPTKTRAYLKIQDGCNNRCSYCTIWRARGKSRSAQIKDVKEQLQIYTEHGFQELVLTGIHIGQWGLDHNPKSSLIDLIDLVENSEIKRFRLGSLNPLEITEGLINHLSQSKKFCPHFHLSLQSACNKTLKAMNRHYSVEHYLEQIEMINESFTLPFVGSDIIVGFPDETDKDFETTCQNILKSKLTTAHVFPYSRRKNTLAAQMSNQIKQEIKLQRANILKNIMDTKYKDFLNKNLKTQHQIMFEKKPCPKTGLYKGLSENYITVYTQSPKNVCNTMQKCLLTNFINEKMYAEVVD